MNCVFLNGRLVAEPQLKTSVNGRHYVYFSIANNMKVAKDAEGITNYVSCIAWGKTAELICTVLHKGSRIWVDSGNIVTSNYTDKQGQKHFDMHVQVYKFDFVASESKRQGSNFEAFGQEVAPDVPF